MKAIVWIWVISLLAIQVSRADAYSGSEPQSRKPALNIYLDCGSCDLDYIRSEFAIVNYVNSWDEADVTVQLTSITSGSGGEAYTIIISGRKEFSSIRDTIRFSTSVTDTEDMARETVLKKIKLGLVSSLLKTPYGDQIDLLVDPSPTALSGVTEDPWKSWAFELYGSAAFSSQKTSESLGFNGSFFISKVTEKFKLQSLNSIGYDKSTLNITDGDSVIFHMDSRQRSFSSRNLVVASLGGHGGIGGMASYSKNDYSNISSMVSAGPAVEFNVFDYQEASRKQFRFIYSITYEHSEYSDTTIYGKMADDLVQQELEIIFNYLENWGSITLTAFGNNYLNNLSQFSVGASLLTGFRLPKGLTLTINASCSYYRNQVSLRKNAGDVNHWLTGQYEMEKGLGYNLYLGLTYRFGSIYNNAVNPRFE